MQDNRDAGQRRNVRFNRRIGQGNHGGLPLQSDAREP